MFSLQSHQLGLSPLLFNLDFLSHFHLSPWQLHFTIYLLWFMPGDSGFRTLGIDTLRWYCGSAPDPNPCHHVTTRPPLLALLHFSFSWNDCFWAKFLFHFATYHFLYNMLLYIPQLSDNFSIWTYPFVVFYIRFSWSIPVVAPCIISLSHWIDIPQFHFPPSDLEHLGCIHNLAIFLSIFFLNIFSFSECRCAHILLNEYFCILWVTINSWSTAHMSVLFLNFEESL